MSDAFADLRPRFEANGQGHVFQWYDKGLLSDEQVASLRAQLEPMNLERINHLFKETMAARIAGISEDSITPCRKVENVGKIGKETLQGWHDKGLRAIAAGEVGIILLAGGQGTRLGFSKPKGMYNVGLPGGDTLFALQAQQIARLRVLAAEIAAVPVHTIRLPWYVMTSPQTDKDTVQAFRDNNFYGLNPADVVFFSQGTLPCYTYEGKIIMENGYTVSSAPDGNGGIYHALVISGVLDDMTRRGVKYLPQYCVDNAVVKVADPTFVGYCIEHDADVGGKAVAKVAWNEKVGVFCEVDGKFSVVEYSDISETIAKRTDPATGELVFSSSHICINYYSLEYFKRIATQLPAVYHVAEKKIPYADEDGKTKTADKNNGIKLESFIFDVFPLARNPVVYELADRFGEFAPIKNAPGSSSDSPDQARTMANEMFRNWITAAGGSVRGSGLVAISALVSYGGEGLAGLAGAEVVTPCLIKKRTDGGEGLLETAPLEDGSHCYLL